MFNLINMVAFLISIISSYFVKSPMFAVLIPHLLLAKSPFDLLKFTSFLVSKHPNPSFPEETTSNSQFAWFQNKWLCLKIVYPLKSMGLSQFSPFKQIHLGTVYPIKTDTHKSKHPGFFGMFYTSTWADLAFSQPHLHPAGHSPPGSSTTRDPQPAIFRGLGWRVVP